ncbi:DUF2726 domain-containing protein [Patescibacteria group bacterium]|nr:DUF2726 domain-containing protein [Patescibacteria group bacterium]
MEGFFALTIFALFLVVIFSKASSAERNDSEKLLPVIKEIKKIPGPYEKLFYRSRKFLTYTEHRYYTWLEKEYGEKFHIVPQVVLASIIDVNLPKHLYAYNGYRSKIDKKTLDFVLFDKVDFMPVLAIELDDYTHEHPDRQKRDRFVDAVMEKVGIGIVHLTDVFDIKQKSIH